MSDSIVHFHTHSSYSVLDGAGTAQRYAQKAALDNSSFLVITDHGMMTGLPTGEKAAKDNGLIFIPGIEAYQEVPSEFNLTSDSDDDTEAAMGKNYCHLSMYAMDQRGLEDLYKIHSWAAVENFNRKPLVTFEVIKRFNRGSLMATSSCLGGVVLQAIMQGKLKLAEQFIDRFVDIFGRDKFFIEIQRHGIAEQDETNPVLMMLAKQFGLLVIATNDVHYCNHDDERSHDNLLCQQTGSLVSLPVSHGKIVKGKNRFGFTSDQHWFKTSEEMRYTFSELEFACDNTIIVAEMVDPNIKVIHGDKWHFPNFPVPAEFHDSSSTLLDVDHSGLSIASKDNGKTPADRYVEHLAWIGFKERYGPGTKEQRERLEYEMGIISNMGFSTYFLVLWDIVNFCNKQDIPLGVARGSAGGCCLAYCLKITNIDPIKYDLIFERFLNPERTETAPDIDMDISQERREEVINYCIEKYGREFVAQIITVVMLKAKTSIKDVARVEGYPYLYGDELTKLIPDPLFGKDIPLKEALSSSPSPQWEVQWKDGQALRDRYRDDPEAAAVLNTALKLEGLVKSVGIHPSGIVIGDVPLVELMPLHRVGGKSGKIVTAYTMDPIEKLKIPKIDLLGLRNLDIIRRCIRNVNRIYDLRISEETIPQDDPATYALLGSGNTTGVFQVESPAMRQLLRDIAISSFDDIAAVLAIYRPGPLAAGTDKAYANRKHGRESYSAFHPDVEDIFGVTYGLLTYQEQVMKVMQVMGGWSMGRVDSLRKAIGKKLPEEMPKYRQQIIDSFKENGHAESVAITFWNMVEPCAAYLFNRSHSYGYGMITYQTAYLKAHYPIEYMASILNSADASVAGIYLSECNYLNIPILPPDINYSEGGFTPVGDKIVFGLSGIKGIGMKPVLEIVAERQNNGLFVDFDDFRRRIPPKILNKKLTTGLISSGAFDSMHSRGGLLASQDPLVKSARDEGKKRSSGVRSIFDMGVSQSSSIIPDIELSHKQIAALEEEYLGTYVLAHPLKPYGKALAQVDDIATVIEGSSSSSGTTSNKMERLAGYVKSLRTKNDKNGNLMAFFEICDFSGAATITAFSSVWKNCKVSDGDVVLIDVKRDKQNSSRFLLQSARRLGT